jgi:hypothetical protein
MDTDEKISLTGAWSVDGLELAETLPIEKFSSENIDLVDLCRAYHRQYYIHIPKLGKTMVKLCGNLEGYTTRQLNKRFKGMSIRDINQ